MKSLWFSRPIWLGTILSFRRNIKELCCPLPYIYRAVPAVYYAAPEIVLALLFQALRNIIAPAASMVRPQSSLIITPEVRSIVPRHIGLENRNFSLSVSLVHHVRIKFLNRKNIETLVIFEWDANGLIGFNDRC